MVGFKDDKTTRDSTINNISLQLKVRDFLTLVKDNKYIEPIELDNFLLKFPSNSL